MAVYVIANVSVTDPERFAEYGQGVPASIALYGGTYLVRGGAVEVKEGSWRPRRLVIIQFESMERFRAWYDGPEYAALKPIREQAAESDLIVVQGVS
jgi:uncharacterized protein (DUF1330 family)